MATPLSIQLYTLRDQIAADRDGTLARLAEIGYRSVEAYDPTADPAGFRRTADALGMSVSSTHAYALFSKDPGEVFDAVAAIGTDLAIIPGGIAHDEFTTAEGLRRTADLLNGFAGRAAERGIRIGYHNHWWELEPRFDGRTALEVLAGLLDPAVFLEVDTYWAQVGGADVPELLGALGDRVLALHVKDGPGVKDEPHTAVGKGALDVPSILAAAPDALRIVELDSCATDIFDAVADSHAYLTALEGRS
ncbi:Sugar phosphate isomerase/epimerase [Streptomyces sp. DvalAA-14]|uniref:sugar phosphate isomerase/epimerase family protein n=1 Tax=unclassified Streptomyces TaxID=2593676 RepID=UPI00081AF699|nr:MULTISPECIES: sugar phosphate isomerase/epimerase [unclassified Streptomyces]MYS18727.1 TIM barrel protein [Streptomyces sp. SID4948]SCD28260.1 Sugar phosphate isomerase/epimerase [Streptomyces sp. DvalAA-14]